jgi:hypothetical protein
MITFTAMISMTGAGIASQFHSPRTIGFVAGILSSSTAIFWGWADWKGKLPEPESLIVEPPDVEIHGGPTV